MGSLAMRKLEIGERRLWDTKIKKSLVLTIFLLNGKT